MATVATNQYTYGQPATDGIHYNVKAAFGVYTISSALSANDLINLCKIPKNSLVIGGWMTTTDIDTGTETLEIDIGYTANGGASTATITDATGTTWTNNSSASATGFIDSGVMNGDAITDLLSSGANYRPFSGVKSGPLYFSEETTVQAKITAAAAAGGTGTVYVCVLYVMV